MELFPAFCPFVQGQETDGSGDLQPNARFLCLTVPVGPPTHCTSHPSQPISLFLARNETINELDRSPTLPLELDG